MSVTPETRIDAFLANTTVGAFRPQIETLPNGNFLVMYATSSKVDYFIRGQQFDAKGNAVGTEINFVFDRRIEQPEFDVFVQPNGKVVIAAETDKLNLATAQMVAKTYNLNDGGDNVAIDTDVMPRLGYVDSTNPTLAGLGNGDFNVYYNSSIAGFRDLDATKVRGESIAAVKGPLYAGRHDADISTAVMTNGKTVLVHDPVTDFGLRTKFFIHLYNDNAIRTKTVEINSGARSSDTTVEALTRGGFAVAWSELDRVFVNKSKQDTEVFVQTFDGDGKATSPKIRVGETRNNDHNTNASIVALEDGSFIVFYDKNRHEPGVNGQRYDSDGTVIGEEFQVFDGRVGNIDATLLADNKVAVTFEVFGATVQTEILEFDGFILGNGAANELSGTDEADAIKGGGGNDILRGEAGDDLLDGGAGNDQIFAGGGIDNVEGGNGDDVILGGGGADIIDGGKGNDEMTGGGGSDTFIFRDGDGQDQIIGFNALDDAEVIDLSEVRTIKNFRDLSAQHISQVGSDVVIDDGAGLEITLASVSLADLDANDFVF